MKREYFCANCGLYYWERYPSARVCPSDDCNSHKSEEVQHRYACDSMGFAYFARDNSKAIKEIAWSSEKYAPESAIKHYRKHGVMIK